MAVQLNPHLSFRDSAREAMDFYQSVFGGDLTVSTFAEFHASDDPSEQDKVMHAQLETPDGLVLMAADTPNGMDYQFYFGGTSLLILVGVAMDTVAQIEAQLVMRNYEWFMKKGRIRGRWS